MSEHRRKRARYRAWHRGTREMDLILGRFADRWVPAMDESGLAGFEALLEVPDPTLFAWIVSGEPPAEAARLLVEQLRRERAAAAGGSGSA